MTLRRRSWSEKSLLPVAESVPTAGGQELLTGLCPLYIREEATLMAKGLKRAQRMRRKLRRLERERIRLRRVARDTTADPEKREEAVLQLRTLNTEIHSITMELLF